MLDTLLSLVNRGVDVVRLDAVPFTWKRMGTNCQNQPEAHVLLQMLRALVQVAAPGVVFKAEAIVAPEELVQYLGAHDRYRPECDLAYHNQLMVQLWSSLAARDGQLATAALSRLRPPPAPSDWVTYVRNHDDIGWAICGRGCPRRRMGRLRASAVPARLLPRHVPRARGRAGRRSRRTLRPVTPERRGRRRRCAGSTSIRGSPLRRLMLLYSVVFSYGGIPLDLHGRRDRASQ